ncbi:hypothetical protein [uncultured Oscillibacter sp.]|uniref:hypothetical protein n=1 Tax=uncultured Oscillibacter sp. TaxID=876091 RepID=UPI002628F437|nr:hypothetical protein [uncultured Oscillibacter sp.]
MLRKLLKHEFRATGRVMLPMYLILLVTAVGSNLAGRGMLDGRSDVLNILGVIIVMAFGIAICGVLVMSFVLMIQRFYKNLLQDEGYLMFTLPVSVHQHIWSKLIVSVVWFAATVLAIIAASLVVAYQGGFLREFLDFLGWFFEGLQKLKISETLNGTVYLMEFAVLMFVSLAAFALQFYAALAAGHSRANHKMVWSVAWFFGFQFALQFLGSLLFITLDRLHIPFPLELDWNPSPAVAIHVGLLLAIGVVILYGAIFYAVTTFFLKKHLNLE